jgi:molybdate transport system substrate-binding protein
MGPTVAADPPIIAAASSLNPALDEVRQKFAVETGHSIRLSFGSSGNIAQQIIRGAPFELFLSADERYARSVVEHSLTVDGGTLYALGRLVLYVPDGSPIGADNQLRDFELAVAEGRLERLAIPNPKHAPYGRAARQLLEAHSLWNIVRHKLIMGENVSQTAQFAATGSVDAAILSHSVVSVPAMSRRGRFVVVSEQWHDPIRHRMVLLNGAGPTAVAFYAFLRGPIAREILERYGFSTPQDTP